MSEKRRDSRNRVLRNGESQRSDGRYVFVYVDDEHKQRFLYSWKLVESDPLPEGKRPCVSLREQEKQLTAKLEYGLMAYNTNITVLQLVERYIRQKTGVKITTKSGYQTVVHHLENSPFGKRQISSIRTSDAKIYLIDLQQKEGKSYSSIHSIRGVLRPAFQMAVDDDLLLKNPFEFQLATVLVDDSHRREAVTASERDRFLNFVKEDKHFSSYYDGMYLLFHTGMRISEFIGLTVSDIDLKNREINIDHQLQYKNGVSYISTTKTTSGTRVLPMTDDVYACCKRILTNRKKQKVEPIIDGHAGFLFMNKWGKPAMAYSWEKYFYYAVQKHNRIYKKELPKITPHVCRHTYCSEMAKTGINPKTLQYLMGHSDIGVTLNTYTHLKLEDAKKELFRVVGND